MTIGDIMFIKPMLLQKTDEPLTDPKDYIVELKLDGIRCLYTKINGKVTLYTRHNNIIPLERFPELLNIDIPDNSIIDCELIVADAEGKPDFEAVMSRFHLSKELNIKYASQKAPVTLCAFDILLYKGRDVQKESLLTRKILLTECIPFDTALLTKVKYMDGVHGEALFSLVKQQGLEGAVYKYSGDHSPYENRRSFQWMKLINYQYDSVHIQGYRKGEFGVLIGVEEKGRMVPKGIMELGCSLPMRKEFYQKAKGLKIKEDEKMVYLKPEIQCKIKFRNVTKSNLFRLPVFIEFVN